MGAWIETLDTGNLESSTSSPLAWGRGLKRPYWLNNIFKVAVAPRVGAWIETYFMRKMLPYHQVAPRVGAWIETNFNVPSLLPYTVAPRVGAWIETI